MTPPNLASAATHDGRDDFDFFIGSWTTHHKHLRERLRGSTEWDEFSGTVVCRKLLGGLGNLDEGVFEMPKGRVLGLTLRTFNPNSQQWNIYWVADSAIASGPLDPMIGRFTNGRGEFYAHEPHLGTYIISRFIWTVLSPDACHWEQAFSADGGATWETNWIMDHTRTT